MKNRKTGKLLSLVALTGCLSLQALTSQAQVPQSFEADVTDVMPAKPVESSVSTSARKKVSRSSDIGSISKSQEKWKTQDNYEPLLLEETKALRTTSASFKAIQTSSMKAPVKRSPDAYNVAINDQEKL